MELSLPLWSALRELEAGETALHEVPGAFVVVRLLERDGNPTAALETFRVRLFDFEYIADRGGLGERVFHYHLEIVDPEYEKIVPERWKHAMRTLPLRNPGRSK